MTLSVALRHRFPGFELDVAFEAPAGVTALFGRSGAGKTTVVNAVAGLLRPQAGRVAVNGWELFDTESGLWLPPHRRRVGYVFQDGRLFPHLSVARNLRYGRWFAGRRAEDDRFDDIVDMLGIEPLLARRPGALSGGEKQRVAIGRALLAAPRLLLMDEPLASLDEARKAEILPYLERLRDRTEVPVLYVSHSVPEVARLATTVVTLRDGRVAAAGPAAAVLSEPDSIPDLGVREAGAIIPATVVAHHADGLTEFEAAGGRLLLPRIEAEPGRRIAVRIHAQDVILSRTRPEGLSALNILAGRVAAVRRGEGPGVMVQLDCGGERLLARLTRRSAETLELAPGAPCYAILKSVAVARGDVWAPMSG
ncbi:MAG: molybdenum ABC transporter ATP-binding protein [Rhizobiales bacterium NRL2]|jgi:molybdate transport system ATP-binding protein|nr:MAG: molybdenum ABC transporter ATP-binding protein [Rhizobiales bacterium NRL2]